MTVLFILIVFLLIWIMIDFYFGYKHHQKNHPYQMNDTKSCNLELYTEGHRFFHHLIEDLNHAKQSIFFCSYILRDDTLGQEVIKVLQNKVKSGVKVYLLVDFLGSLGLKKKTVKHLKQNGIAFAYTGKPRFPYFFFSLNRRNHRKITVIDHTIAYFGGFNVGDEYIGQKPKFGYWQDYHLRVTGEAVQDLERQFIQDWYNATKQKLKLESSEKTEGSTKIRLVPTSGYILEKLFIEEIQKAQETILIGTPYFIPSKDLQDSLIKALKRGVKVSIMLPLKRDHPFVRPASYTYFFSLLENGCRIFHFYQGFYHAKVFITDSNMCHLGTANFDMRSLFWNDEINGFIYDKEFIHEIEAMTQKDLDRCVQLTLDYYKHRSILEKGKTAFSSLFSPLL